MWSVVERRRSVRVGIFGTRGACRRAVGWLGSGQLEGKCGLFGSERVPVCMLLLWWHIGVWGEVVDGGEWRILPSRADVFVEACWGWLLAINRDGWRAVEQLNILTCWNAL